MREMYLGMFVPRLRVLLILLAAVGCTSMCEKAHEDMTAEEVVEAYLNKAFNLEGVNEISELIAYSSGNLRQALEEADASTVSRIFVERKYDVKSYTFLSKKDLTPREVEITYELQYKELTSETNAAMTITNTLSLIRRDGAWYITDVIGEQTTIDFQIATEISVKQNSEQSAGAAEGEQDQGGASSEQGAGAGPSESSSP